MNAGNLLYKNGRIEFKNVYFSYTNGLVQPSTKLFWFDFPSLFKILFKYLFDFNRKEILKGVSFTVLPGQTVALVSVNLCSFHYMSSSY